MERMSIYINHRLSTLDELKIEPSTPMQLSEGGFLMCLEGDCSVVIDTKEYHLSKGDLVVAFPYSVTQLLRSSPDFQSVVVGVSALFFANIPVRDKSSYFTTIREHPSILLEEAEMARILSLREQLIAEQQRVDHLFHSEIEESILSIMLYEIAAIYRLRRPNKEQVHSRSDVIFHRFIFLLFNDFKRERSLNYYAQQQQITPSHLSKVVRQVSGRNATDWLIGIVVNNMKFRLQDKRASVGEIAAEFNFPNSSFFSQYFKRYTGITPREYRNSCGKS